MANNEAGRTRVDDAQASKLTVSTRMNPKEYKFTINNI
jgi:hypothetical protein